MAADQQERSSSSFLSTRPGVIAKIAEREKARIEEVLSILAHIKSPSTNNIGLDGSRAVWLIALHNYGYKDAGRTVLKKMQRLYYKNNDQVFYPGIPYLVDRIMLAAGRFNHSAKQLYGTQGWSARSTDGVVRSAIYPIINIAGLEKRRKKFGLAFNAGPCRHKQ